MNHWSEQKEVGHPFMMSLFVWMAKLSGRTIARIALLPVTLFFMLTAHNSRAASRQYLYRINKVQPTIAQTFKHFFYFATVALDRVYLMCGKYEKFDVEVEGQDVFKELTQNKQGCLLFVSHVGSFDIMRVPGARQHALPIRVLMDAEHNSMAMRIINKLDPDLASSIIDAKQNKAELIIKLSECINRGEMIGIMADRLQSEEQGASCQFLGGKAHFPESPWQLASVLKVPVILCFGLYLGGNKYKIRFELITEGIEAKRSDRQQQIMHHIQHYSSRLEYYLKQQPYNWFNFYQFWPNESTSNS